MKRVVHELSELSLSASVDFIFLSEVWLFQADVPIVMKGLSDEFCWSLNSEDLFVPDLSLRKSRAHGGTMILWRKRHDPFVKPLETTSSHFNVVLFKPPMNTQSIHVCIYLPTAGLDQEFLEELSALENTIEELKENYPGTPIYVRGDANAALPIRDSNKRDAVFSCFCK